MFEQQDNRLLSEYLAGPPSLAPSGLIILGITAGFMSLYDADLFGLDASIPTTLLICGGIGQLVVAVVEWKRKNLLGTAVFASYGLFWFSLIALVVAPRAGWAPAPQPLALATYLAAWGFFSVVLFSGALRSGLSLRTIFGFLAAYFFLTAIAVATENHAAKVVAGIEGIICGLIAIRVALIQATHRRKPSLNFDYIRRKKNEGDH